MCGEEDEWKQQHEIQGHSERPAHETHDLDPPLVEDEAGDQSSNRPNDAPYADHTVCAQFPVDDFHGPNETKMSDGGRERASLGVEVWKSFQKWNVQRSAVRSIAWLDLFIR